MLIESVGDLVREFGMSSDDEKVALILNQAYSRENREGCRDVVAVWIPADRAPDLYNI